MVIKSGNLFSDDGNRIGCLLSMDGADDTKDECGGEQGFHEKAFEVLKYKFVGWKVMRFLHDVTNVNTDCYLMQVFLI